MKYAILNLYWSVFGYPDYPPKLKNHNPRLNSVTRGVVVTRSYSMYRFYCSNGDIQTIADFYDVTRERVRQCLWKEYRRNMEGK